MLSFVIVKRIIIDVFFLVQVLVFVNDDNTDRSYILPETFSRRSTLGTYRLITRHA